MSSEALSGALSLDHVTIVSQEVGALRDFLCDVVGLVDGPRPPFSVKGHWLYAQARPVIHLIARTEPATTGQVTPRIDHVALRVRDASAWHALLARIEASGFAHSSAIVPLTGERQLFVQFAPSVVFEFVAALDFSDFSPFHPRRESQA